MRKLLSNVYVTNSMIVDVLSIVINAVSDDDYSSEYIDKSVIENIQNNYYIKELLLSLKMKGLEFLEFLMYTDDFDDFEKLKNIMLECDRVTYLHILSGYFVDKSYIEKMLEEDKINEIFKKLDICSSVMIFDMLIKDKQNVINKLFSCLEEVRTDDFKKKYSNLINTEFYSSKRIENMIRDKEPLEVSEEIMGKTFRNRGPYKNFTFIPSFFMKIKFVRYFKQDQILIYSRYIDKDEDEKIHKVLKIVADNTRFQILDMLSTGNAITGKDISRKLELSKPTISHHIDALKESGFINEERVKNSKYYSLNYNNIEKFINAFSKKFNNK